MIIDAHAHFVPASLLEVLPKRAAEFPSVSIEQSGASLSFAFAGGKRTRPTSPGLTDLEKRVAWMDESGVERQVVAGWLDMFGYEMPAEEGEAWCRLINEDLIAFCAANPRFVPLGATPMQDGERAAAMLRDLRAQGVAGVMIGTQPDNKGGRLDAPELEPFWRAADETKAVVQIHPSFNSGDDRASGHGLENALGRVTDITLAVARMLVTGMPTKYPGARIIAVCGGGALAFALGRLQRGHQIAPDNSADPHQQLRALYFDTIVHDPAALRFLADKVGADRLMAGSDKPFPIGDFTMMKTIEAAGFSESEQRRMAGGLAGELFGL